MAVQWQLFPRFQIVPEHLVAVVSAFEKVGPQIASPLQQLKSDAVLAVVRPHLEEIGFEVETGKGTSEKLERPVLFGLNGKAAKSFHVDAFQGSTGTVIEVEAGRAVVNHQFLKDLFEACAMQDAEYLVIAVMNGYQPPSAKQPAPDFLTVTNFIDTLYASGRLDLPLRAVMVVGY